MANLTAAAITAAIAAYVTGAKWQGTLQATTCTLPANAPVVPGQCPGRAAAVGAYQAIAKTYPGQTANGGFAKGTQAWYAFAAWYVAACGGLLQTRPGANGLHAPYTNAHLYPSGNANPGKPLAAANNTPGRLTAHAHYVLRMGLGQNGVVAAPQAPTPAPAPAKAKG